MKTFVTGGTGFVGSHIVPRLLQAGHQVRMLARDPAGARAKLDAAKVAPSGPQLEIVAGDVVRNTGLDEAVQGCDAVIHLVGIIMEVGEATFEKVHYQGTSNVLAAARKSGVRRFVQMSALGARKDG